MFLSKKSTLFLSCFIMLSQLTLSAEATTSTTTSASTTTWLVRSTRLAPFVSGWAQSATTSPATGNLVVDNNDFTFMCPGQSFLVGFQTNYDGTLRHFRLACAFYENASGVLASKTVANCSTTGWDNKAYGSGASTCSTAQFVAGFNVAYSASERDSQYKAACCPVDSPDQTTISSDSCSAPQTLNAYGGASGLTLCGGDMAVQAVQSTFQTNGSTGSDRIISFKCCRLAAH